MSGATGRVMALHGAAVAALFAANFLLPEYHHGVLARVMVLAVYAMGYNLVFGYAGLLSLGHAMFFAAGLYGAGMTIQYFGWPAPAAFVAGCLAGAALAVAAGALALRTAGVAFMIVTMMFSQAFFLATLYFGNWTRGDEGLVLTQAARTVGFGGLVFDPTDPATRYVSALLLFSVVLFATLGTVRSRFGRVLVAVRENEERARLLGYDTFAVKLTALAASGLICGAAGAAYAVLFGYVGSTFASVQYSILPLLWVLLGGAATVLGPFLGTLLMFYLVDFSGDLLRNWLPDGNLSQIGIIGVALVVLVLFFPAGLLGWVRARWARWLP